MRTKVRVKRGALLTIVQGRIKKAERDHERAVAAYPELHEKWKADCVAKLEKALESAKRGKVMRDKYGEALTMPSEPHKPASLSRELCKLRRIEATLKIGAEDTILLSQQDADAYFGPCQV